jgi:EAL domain-containing protein (putative c-di-GMP-specific phosphodiesterase class I)/GGDEF domain-containing protein
MLERVALERELERLMGSGNGVTRTLPLAILRIKDSDRIYTKLGHAGADELLQIVEQRLVGALAEHPELHAVGNLGVQRSALLFVPDTAREQANAITRKVLESMVRPYHVRGKEVFVQFCAGLAAGGRRAGRVGATGMESLEAEPVRELLLEAEAAAKAAKGLGCACVEEFRDDMPIAAIDAARLEADLHYAVGKGELRLVYQPQVDLVTDEVVGFEALVRWQHPELGMVSPNDFIQMAEENGTILSIGEWVLREACTQMAEWLRQRMPIRRIAVNVSAVQFMESDLVATTAACLAAAGLPGSCLQLEITESAIVRNVALTQRIIAGLQELGVSIAIDDFGVGYSSLAYLRQLRFDELKIDRSFVQNMENEPEKLAIVDLILGLAERMGFQVTAEGIENQAVRSLLASRRCRHGQGYYFARPMAPESIHAMLAALGHGPRPQSTDGGVRRPRPFTARGMASVVNPSSAAMVAPSQTNQAWRHQQTLFGS